MTAPFAHLPYVHALLTADVLHCVPASVRFVWYVYVSIRILVFSFCFTYYGGTEAYEAKRLHVSQGKRLMRDPYALHTLVRRTARNA